MTTERTAGSYVSSPTALRAPGTYTGTTPGASLPGAYAGRASAVVGTYTAIAPAPLRAHRALRAGRRATLRSAVGGRPATSPVRLPVAG
jgi:hypothetical protein